MLPISIIVPVYNVEPYLRKCLDSLLAQTFTDIEVLCVNDGSTDNSLAILREYANKDERIKVFTHENQGVGYTRNVGLKNARGKYIMWCDPDDWYEPTMCEEMFSAIEREDVDLVTCVIRPIDMSNGTTRFDDASCWKLYHSGKCELNDNLKANMPCNLVNKILKREVFSKYNILAPDTARCSEDGVIMWEYLLLAKTAYWLNKPLYNHLLRTTSINGSAGKQWLTRYADDHILMFSTLIRFIIKHNLLAEVRFALYHLNLFIVDWAKETEWLDYFKRIHSDVLALLDENVLMNESILLTIRRGDYDGARQTALLGRGKVAAMFLKEGVRKKYAK
ncbi:hypothetical protein RsTz2092_06880 [Deferribacterales bacterium RsTz2092]|nr:hypothetical protein AGMMS49941_05030 [Deferribacterales bacterium]